MNLQNPAPGGEDVVVGTPFGSVCAGLYVGTGGDVTVTMKKGQSLVFKNVADGSILPIQATAVTAVTGAADMIALIN